MRINQGSKKDTQCTQRLECTRLPGWNEASGGSGWGRGQENGPTFQPMQKPRDDPRTFFFFFFRHEYSRAL